MAVKTIPLKLAECVTTLYRADGALNPILDAPVWVGSKTEGLEVDGRIAMVDSTPSGAIYGEEEQLGESHDIGFERIWAVNPASSGADRDFVLARGKYVLVVYWESKRTRFWQKRTYYGVQCRGVSMRSNGQVYFGQRQMFGARFYVPDEGRNTVSSPSSPLLPSGSTGSGTSTGTEQPIGFQHVGAMAPGDYFLGQYQFSDRSVTVTWAKANARASQTTATVLGLEVNGVMTALTLTLPVGAANAEVSAGGTVTPVVVAVGGVMRWKVVSGPSDVESQAYAASIGMTVE